MDFVHTTTQRLIWSDIVSKMYRYIQVLKD